MIEISKEQQARLLQADREDFIERLCADVKKDAPWVERAWPSELIYEQVSYAVDRATIANGFTADLDVVTFVSLMFVISPDFDQHPAIHKLLFDTSLPTEKRWDILAEDKAYAAAWQEMNKLEHQDNWFVEGRGKIEEAYPTTYNLPGFIALYNKRRAEKYPYLKPGESVDDD